MQKVKIFHKRQECIGCGLCAEVAPNYWYMNEDDGLASLHTRLGKDGPYHKGEGWREDKQILEEASKGCPVQIIKVNS